MPITRFRLKLALLATHKICSKCKKDLPTSEFYIHKNGYYQSVCKRYNNIVHLEYKEKNKLSYNQRETNWRHNTGRSKFLGQGQRGGRKARIQLGSRGNSYDPNWDIIKKEIYKRDNWTCQECGEKCHVKGQIQCHHIDYDTENNEENNLITLCRRCHAMTNIHKREFFIWYYKIKILLIIGE
jgi:hypothetical protein